jgi:hypothetical protein
MFALGAVLSPLATQPFLAPRHDDFSLNATAGPLEISQSTYTQIDSFDPGSQGVTESLPGVNGGGGEQTRVFYALLVSGMLCLFTSVLMMGLFFVKVKPAHSPKEGIENYCLSFTPLL